MAYSEELDLIQNVKNLSNEVGAVLDLVGDVEPSIDQILELKEQFQNLSDNTLAVIDRYQVTLDEKSSEIVDMLESGRSQINQVTDDVEALVNLEVDFASIKSKIENCLDFSNSIIDLMTNGVNVLMTSGQIVPVNQRVSYRRYLEVTSVSTIQ